MEIRDMDEKSIIEMVRSSPELKACILEMIDITAGEDFEKIDLGDHAEEAVVEIIQKTGRILLSDWVKKKVKKAEEEAHQNRSIRTHKKKE